MKLKLNHTRNSIRQITSLLFLSGALCLNAVAGSETWTGAAGDNNWNTAGNWSGPNTPPVAGDIISFGAQGAGGLTLNNNLTVDTALLGLNFNATAPSFVLAGNEIAPTGAIIDNSLNLQTINLPIATTVTNNLGAASGSTLLIGGVISGAGGGINKTMGGTVKLNNNNTYTGGTTISAGTLTLDYSGAATSIIPSTSGLTLGGGALNVIGNSAAASSQTFAATTINAGGSMVSAAPVSGANLPTVALGNIYYNVGGTIQFVGPAYNNAPTAAAGQDVSGLQAATANITTTTTANNGLLRGTGSTPLDATYGTVGLYDVAGLNGSTVVGASQLANPGGLGTAGDGYYTIVNAGAVPTGSHDNQIIDVIGACTDNSTSSTYNYAGMRFNSPGGSLHVAYWTSLGIILVTPNVGANNVPIAVSGIGIEPAERDGSNPGSIVIWQNNILGFLSIDSLIDGKVVGGSFVKDGQGTFIATGAYTVQQLYTGQTYVNNGVWQIYADLGLGLAATGAQVNLNGGTVLGAATLTLDNAGANIRPIALGSNGGGLAATAGTTMTVDGVISGAAPLTIGIPASSANNYTAGLVPGTGPGTANTATNASGTVVLTGANTYTGNTIVSSGTLQLGATGVILSTNIITSPGGTYDVSLISGYTLNSGYSLMGGGAVNGAVNAASGSGIYGGTDGTYGTNTFNNNLTLASGAAVYFDLGASATGPNDQIVVNGNLTFNGNVIHLKAPSTAAILDMVNDYTLFSSPNLITVASTPTIVWDVPPANNWPKYILVVAGNTVRLHYVASPGPFIVSSSALPNPAYDNENILISAMVMTNGSTLKSITVDASQIAGTAPGTTILTLVSTGTANPTIYTNSVVVGAAVPLGSVSYYSTAIDNANLTFLGTNTLSIISGAPVMSGVTAVPNPVSPGQLVTVTATVVGYSYPISSVTVTGSAISGSPLTLVSSNGTSVYTNSATVTAAGVLTVTGTDSANNTVTANLTLNLMDIWSGDGSHNYWDLTSANWVNGGPKYAFANGDGVTFNNNGSVAPPLNISATVVPSSVLVSSTTRNYVFTGSGSISGSTGLTKTNGSTLTILNTNSYTGPTVIYGGVLELQTGAPLISGALGAIGAASSSPANLVFNGSTLRYSGSDTNVTDHGMTIAGGIAVDVTNPAAVFTVSGVVTGSGGMTKLGQGTLTPQNANTYTGGTVISNGMVAMGNNNANWNLSTAGGFGAVTNPVTFMGTNATLQLYGWMGYTSYTTAFNDFTNPLVVPAGQVGTLQLPGRGSTATGAGAGLDSSLTGSGTLNLVANYVRYPLSGNWSGFTGQINVTGAGFPNVNNNTVGAVTADIDELRFNYTNYANAAFYLYGSTAPGNQNSPQSTLVMCQTVASGATIDIGELGCDPSTPTPVIGTGTGSAGNTTWRVGWKNTTNTFYGVIANDAQTGVGVTSITKVGTGKWVLAGANTYSGSTTVSNGVLALIMNPQTYNDASIAYSTNIFIAANAVLDLSGLSSQMLTLNAGQALGGRGTLVGSVTANSGANLNPGSPAGTGALTINGGLTEVGGVNNNFQLTNVSPNVIRVLGDLNVSSGIQNINFSGFGTNTIAYGTYPLFTYTGNFSGPLNNLFVTFGAAPYGGILTNITTTTPPEIAVIVGPPTRAATNVVWVGDGVANNWDTIGTNWLIGATATRTVFQSGDSAIFNNAGAANTNVTLQAALYPASVVVSNSALVSYTLTGSGSIAGSIGLLKTNTGTVTILTTNTYTGPTVIGGGTISVSYLPNGGVAGPLGAASNNTNNLVFAGGTLAYTGPSAGTDRGATLSGSGGTFDVIGGTTLTNNGVIAGSGPLTLTDAGGLTLTNANTYTNGTIINNGTLTLNNATSAGTGTITLNGGTLAFVGTIANAVNVASNATASATATAQINGAITGGGTLNLNLTSAGSTFTFGASAGSMSAFTGTVKVTDATPYAFLRLSAVTGSSAATFDLGNSSIVMHTRDPLTVNLGGLAGGTNTVLEGARSSAGTDTYNIGANGFNTTFNGTISNGIDSGTITPVSINKVGTGTLTLGGSNLYSGTTTVSNGVLLVNGSINNDNTNDPPITVSGGTLGGSGIIGGVVTVQVGGTLAPGAGTNVAGTVLTLNSNLTLQAGGTTIMRAVHGASPDQVTSAGTITYGGLLLINTNGDSTPYQAGDTIQLFTLGAVSGAYNAGSSFNSIQPRPGPGLVWDASQLTTSGTLAVVAGAPAAVVANLAASPTSGSAALAVTFTNRSSGANYWVWNFGDGTILPDTTGGNVTHTYSTANFTGYTVIQTAYGPGGSSALTNAAYIVVTNATPVASFVGVPTNGSAPLAVTFTNLSSGGLATNYLWSFGDGAISNTTSAGNVSHSYTNSGTYGVGLTITGTGGSSTLTNTAYIVVTTSAVAPAALFTNITAATIFVTQSVTFTNTSTGGITNSAWNFGDTGTTNLTLANASNTVTHVFNTSGSYTVQLIVTSPGGSGTNSTTAGYIVVKPKAALGGVTLAGGKLVFSGANGPAGQTYRILTATNVALPLASWTPVWTNVFAADGSYSCTNTLGTNASSFFLLVSP